MSMKELKKGWLCAQCGSENSFREKRCAVCLTPCTEKHYRQEYDFVLKPQRAAEADARERRAGGILDAMIRRLSRSSRVLRVEGLLAAMLTAALVILLTFGGNSTGEKGAELWKGIAQEASGRISGRITASFSPAILSDRAAQLTGRADAYRKAGEHNAEKFKDGVAVHVYDPAIGRKAENAFRYILRRWNEVISRFDGMNGLHAPD